MNGRIWGARALAALAGIAALGGAHAAEPTPTEGRIDLDTTIVSGNQELPKVLYIVPWQAPDRRPALPAPEVSVDDGLFRRLRPAEHRREVFYLDHLTGTDPKE
jgi:hypothetical protein